jgi:hypothetical protein
MKNSVSKGAFLVPEYCQGFYLPVIPDLYQ